MGWLSSATGGALKDPFSGSGSVGDGAVKGAKNFVKDPLQVAKDAVENVYKESVRVTEEAFKVGGNVVNNVIAETSKAVTTVTSGDLVRNISRETDRAYENTGNALKDAGNDTWVSIVDAGGDIYTNGMKALSDYFYYIFGGFWVDVDRIVFGGSVDKNTGGTGASLRNASNTFDDLAQGKSIEDNLKDAVRLSAITATVMLTAGTGSVTATGIAAYTSSGKTVGYSERPWGEILGGLAQQFLPGPIGGMVNSWVNPPRGQDGIGANYNSTYTPTSAADRFIYEGDAILPVIVVGGGAIVCLLLLKKMKKH